MPELESNLLSVKMITEKGFSVNFVKNKCYVVKDNIIYLEAVSSNGSLYGVILDDNPFVNSDENFAFQGKNVNCIHSWHKKCGTET